MHVRYALTIALLATALTASPSLAQLCEGRPGADAGSAQLGAGVAVGNRAREFGVSISALGKRAYGAASVGSVSFNDFTGTATSYGVAVGYQLAVGASGRAQLCPFVSGSLGFGPKDIRGTGVDLSTRGAGAGLAWGFRAARSLEFGLVPTISAAFGSSSATLTDGVDDLTESKTFGQLGIGLGFMFGQQFAVRPAAIIPLGLEGADPVVELTISLTLGSRR